MTDYATKDRQAALRASKPLFRLVGGVPIPTRRETPLEAARRRYGRPFGSETWATGEGPRYWTADRVARLAADNERLRRERM